MPQVEEYGYTSLEAQALGCPVIACAISGTRETLIEGVTGLTFASQTVEAVVEIVEKCDIISTSLKESTQREAPSWLENFSTEAFVKAWQEVEIKTNQI